MSETPSTTSEWMLRLCNSCNTQPWDVHVEIATFLTTCCALEPFRFPSDDRSAELKLGETRWRYDFIMNASVKPYTTGAVP
jgi:hypothetical protein